MREILDTLLVAAAMAVAFGLFILGNAALFVFGRACAKYMGWY